MAADKELEHLRSYVNFLLNDISTKDEELKKLKRWRELVLEAKQEGFVGFKSDILPSGYQCVFDETIPTIIDEVVP